MHDLGVSGVFVNHGAWYLYPWRRPESERLRENDGDLPSLVLVGALLIPFIYRQRFRDSSNRAALWLKPHGDGFIFHPFGKLGKAYRVSAAARDLIMARLTTRTKIFYCVLLVAIMPSLALASLDPADFAALRPYLSIARIAVLLLALLGMWIWHRLAIHPLYADAPELSVRISMAEVSSKKASYTSWTTISLMIARLGLVVCGLVCTAPAPTSSLRVACRAHHPYPCRANDPSLVFQAENQNRRLIGPAEVEIVD